MVNVSPVQMAIGSHPVIVSKTPAGILLIKVTCFPISHKAARMRCKVFLIVAALLLKML